MKYLFCIFMVVLGSMAYTFFYRRSKDVLNPFGITIITWNIIAGISSLQLSYLQQNWSRDMYAISLLFPLTVFVAGTTGAKGTGTVAASNPDTWEKIEITNSYRIVSRFVFIICILCALVEWQAQGFIIPFLVKNVFDVKSLVVTLPVVHYGTVFLPYCAICAIWEFFYRKDMRKKTVLFLTVIVGCSIFHSLFIVASRGTLLILVLGGLYIVARRYRFSVMKIALPVMGLVWGLVLIIQNRVGSTSLVFHVIRDHPILSAIYSYTGLNLENLNKLTYKGPDLSIIKNSFLGVWQMFGYGTSIEANISETTEFFNATTICYYFYEDLWLIGVVLYTFLIYAVLKFLYNKSMTDSRYVLMIAVLQKAIWMTFFGNYFTAYRVILLPYLVIGIIIFTLRTRITGCHIVIFGSANWRNSQKRRSAVHGWK